MGPSDLAPNTAPPDTSTPEAAEKAQRNAFFNSLSIEAKGRFLEAAAAAAERGATEEEAWREAVVAAEMAYADVPPPDRERIGEPGPEANP